MRRAALMFALIAATPALAARPALAPGEQQCVQKPLVESIVPYGKGGLKFVMRGRTDYINKADGYCDFNPDFDVLISVSTLDQYCSLDIIRFNDRQTGAFRGSCSLSGFTPLPRPPLRPRPSAPTGR